MSKTSQIDIESLLSGEERITREGGEKLRKQILRSTPPVSIDFKHKAIASVSFWDESIAKLLLEGWTEAQVAKNVVLTNVHPRDLEIIHKLIQARLRALP
jgi:hypothetical protein